MVCNEDVCDIFPEESDFIFTITALEKIEELKTKTGKKTGIADFGASRIIGFYFTYDDAYDVVTNNQCNIYEMVYKYVLVEKIAPGVYNGATSESRTLFKYNREKNKYEPVEEPAFLSRLYGIGIG